MITMQKMEKTVAVQNGVISYDVEGEGEAVLCLPSLLDTRREYEFLAPALIEAGYKVITTDLRGMGQSRGNFKSHSLTDLTSDIAAILDAEKIKKAYLIACSVSGASAGLFAAQHPERVIGLVLFNPIVHTGSRLQTAMLVTLLRVPGLGISLLSSYFKSLYPLRPVDPEYHQYIIANFKLKGAMKSVADMSMTPRIDNQIKDIKVPTTIFYGSKDPDFKDVKAEMATVQEKLPQATLHLLEGVGHYPQHEVPEQVLPEVLEWLKSGKSN